MACWLVKLKVRSQRSISSGVVTIIRMSLREGKLGVGVISALQGMVWM